MFEDSETNIKFNWHLVRSEKFIKKQIIEILSSFNIKHRTLLANLYMNVESEEKNLNLSGRWHLGGENTL